MSLLMRTSWVFLLGVFPLSTCSVAALVRAQDKKPETQTEEKKEQTEEKKEDDGKSGQDLLTEATKLKVQAKTTDDLDKIIEILEQAMKKNLSDEDKPIAQELLESTLLEYAEQTAAPIFSPMGPDKRFKYFRRQALTKLDRLEELGSKSSKAYALIAKLCALGEFDIDRARGAAAKAVEFAGDNKEELAEALLLRASLAEDENSRMADLNQALKLDPNNVNALRQRALYFLLNQKADQAVKDLKQIIEINGGDENSYAQLMQASLEVDNIDDFFPVAQEAIDKFPGSAELRLQRARMYLMKAAKLGEEEEEQEAEEDSEKPEEKQPDAAEEKDKIHAPLGNLFLASTPAIQSDEEKEQAIEAERNRLLDLAIADLDEANKIQKDNLAILLTRAEVLYNRERYEDARKDIDRALGIRPGLVAAIRLRAAIAAAEKKYDEAAEDLNDLVQNFPEETVYKIQLAIMYTADDQFRKAIELYDEVLKTDPENQMAVRGRADAYLSLGEHKDALSDYEEALKQKGADKDDHILNNLSWLLSTSPDDEIRNGKRALELALKACEVTKYKRPHILSTLAAGYAETGDFEKAKEWAAKAVELAEKSESDQEIVEDLKKELASYQEGKPWRELKEEDKSKSPKRNKEKKSDFDF